MKRFWLIKLLFCLILMPILVGCGSISKELNTEQIVDELKTIKPIDKGVETFLHPSALSAIQPTQTLKVLIPLYKDPQNGIEDWQKIADAADKVSITVIVNPSAGPLGCQQSRFQEALNLVTNRGVTVLGYVPTGFGFRDIGQVHQDITNYQACPQIGGIFLDEISREASQVNNIRSLCSYVRGAPSLARTVLNAGTSVNNTILEDIYCDTVVSFEKDVSKWMFSYDSASVTFPNPDYFATLIHTTATENIYQAVDLARERGFGYIYMSGDTLPNPWSKLPVFWESVVNYIKLGNDLSSPAPPEPPVTSSILVNSGFDNFEGWLNCGDPNSYYINNSALNVTAGTCVYQTVPAVPNATYTLTCAGNTSADTWNTFILTTLDSNWQSINQDFKPITTTASSQSITVVAPSYAAHIAVSFYSEGSANYSSCALESSGGTPVQPQSIVNPSFDTFEGWANCADANSYYIANGQLKLFSGACVYQTIRASEGRNYTLTCTGNINDNVWSTYILSALNSDWQTISQVYKPLELNNVTRDITLNAPPGTAHMAVSFYTEGAATYQECYIN